MNMDYGPNIAGFELLPREVCFQSDPVVFLDHTALLDRIGRNKARGLRPFRQHPNRSNFWLASIRSTYITFNSISSTVFRFYCGHHGIVATMLFEGLDEYGPPCGCEAETLGKISLYCSLQDVKWTVNIQRSSFAQHERDLHTVNSSYVIFGYEVRAATRHDRYRFRVLYTKKLSKIKPPRTGCPFTFESAIVHPRRRYGKARSHRSHRRHRRRQCRRQNPPGAVAGFGIHRVLEQRAQRALGLSHRPGGRSYASINRRAASCLPRRSRQRAHRRHQSRADPSLPRGGSPLAAPRAQLLVHRLRAQAQDRRN